MLHSQLQLFLAALFHEVRRLLLPRAVLGICMDAIASRDVTSLKNGSARHFEDLCCALITFCWNIAKPIEIHVSDLIQKSIQFYC